jgi:hypothetical protein
MKNKRLLQVGLPSLVMIIGILTVVYLLPVPSDRKQMPTITAYKVAAATPAFQIVAVTSPLSTPGNKETPTAEAQSPSLATQERLFIDESGHLRWHGKNGVTHILLSIPLTTSNPTDEVWHNVQYTTDRDRQKLLIEYGHGVFGKEYVYALLLYDPIQTTLTTLLTTQEYIMSFALSPDQQWAAYILRDIPPPQRHVWWRHWLGGHQCYCGEPPHIGTIYAMRLQPPYQAQKVAVCGTITDECIGLLGWPFHNEQLRWQDDAGYWAANRTPQ